MACVSETLNLFFHAYSEGGVLVSIKRAKGGPWIKGCHGATATSRGWTSFLKTVEMREQLSALIFQMAWEAEFCLIFQLKETYSKVEIKIANPRPAHPVSCPSSE
jgi:hypothetical protein